MEDILNIIEEYLCNKYPNIKYKNEDETNEAEELLENTLNSIEEAISDYDYKMKSLVAETHSLDDENDAMAMFVMNYQI